MNTDIRVAVSFLGHRKRKKLQRKLGPAAVLCLIDLWIVAAMNKPDGILAGMDAEDIALDSGWEGEPQEFVEALIDVGFLDLVDGCYLLHDWHEHNSYAAKADMRRVASRNAADIRWNNKRGMREENGIAPERQEQCGKGAAQKSNEKGQCPDDAPAMPIDAVRNADACEGQCALHTTALPTHAEGNAPVPVPVPVPVPLKIHSDVVRTLHENDPPPPAPDGARHARKGASNFCTEQFALFWDAFDDKRSRERAWTAWRKIKGLDRKLAGEIIAGAKRYALQRKAIQARNGTPKMAEGWLNDRRWEDEGPAVPSPVEALAPEVEKAFERLNGGDDGSLPTAVHG